MADQTVEKPGTELERLWATLELDKDVREVAEEVYAQLMNSPVTQVHSAQKGCIQPKGAFMGVSILLAIKTQNIPSGDLHSSQLKAEISLNGLIRASFPDGGL